MFTGIQLITEERRRQITEEGWSPDHDQQHSDGELALVAALYASPVRLFKLKRHLANITVPLLSGVQLKIERFEDVGVNPWPWDASWDKRNKHSRIKQLAIAGALIAAEIDRLTSLAHNSNSET